VRRRIPRWLSLLLLALLLWAGCVAWLSQKMIAPPRPRISSSERTVLGAVVRPSADGLVVVSSVPPARTAGLRPGDRLLSLDGRPLASAAELDTAVEDAGAGTTVRLEARRADGGALYDVTLESRPISPADLGLPYQDVSLPDRWRLVLRGWYLPPLRGKAPALAFGHGASGDRREGLPLALELHRRGFALLLLDFAGRGESDGEVITLGAREGGDLAAALD
jgi:membrane-associated protease RseP (regulator of RpoE activity)